MEDTQYIDLTHIISEITPPWPGKTPLKRVICCQYEDGYRVNDITLSTGIGMHMHSPIHFYPDLPAIDQLVLTQLIMLAQVMNIAHKVLENADYLITAADIE